MNPTTHEGKKVLILLPSLRISGGIKEALRLAEDLSERGHIVELIVFWKSEHDLPSAAHKVHYLSHFVTNRSLAAVQFPLLLLRFLMFLRQRFSGTERSELSLILTHFSTFPFAWVAPGLDRYCFNQDAEWMFVKEGWSRSLLRWFILATCRRSRVVTTNGYLEALLREKGIRPIGRLSIWPSATWLAGGLTSVRDIDVVMLLRRGHSKRLDLYLEVLDLAKQSGLSSCVITPDPELCEKASQLASHTVLRPSQEEFMEVYKRSKVFLLLSETEGFSLPPVEAMGSGCVPLCRDCGGPRSYMAGPLADNLIPLQFSSKAIFARLQTLLADPDRLVALSDFAMAEFATGAASSILQRKECLDTLSAMLQRDA